MSRSVRWLHALLDLYLGADGAVGARFAVRGSGASLRECCHFLFGLMLALLVLSRINGFFAGTLSLKSLMRFNSYLS